MKTLITTILICTIAMVSPAFAKTDKSVTTTGSITSVDKKSITVLVSKDDSQTYKISKKTVIKLDGVASTEDKLTTGMNASVILTSAKAKSAKEIDATTATPAAAATTPKAS